MANICAIDGRNYRIEQCKISSVLFEQIPFTMNITRLMQIIETQKKIDTVIGEVKGETTTELFLTPGNWKMIS